MKVLRIFPYLSLVFLLNSNLHSELTEEQKLMLESLPPDQRNAVMTKMETANTISEDLEDLFENEQSLVERPDYKSLIEMNKENGEICEDCVFGYDFFKFAPTTYSPVDNLPVPSDYILGPGDKVTVNLYGNTTQQIQSFITREGNFFLPPLGPLGLPGLTFLEARKLVSDRVESEMLGTKASVTLSDIRSINVYLLGEVYQPGKYTMSGLTTVSNALVVSGGVNQNGSLRNISIKRNNEIVSTYDFYEFLLKGSLENDVKLQDGDVVFVPFIGSTSRVGGSFKRPAIYEVLEGESIRDIINLAGGYDLDVPKDAEVEISYFDDLTNKRLFKFLKNDELDLKIYGDTSINVSSTSQYKVETIKLSGEFNKPGEYAIRPGDTILDLIDRAGGYSDESYSEGAVFIRKNVAKLQKDAFLRSADDLEDTIVDIVTKGSIDNITEFTLTPISRLISRLRNEQPVGRIVVELDYLSLKTNPTLNFKVRDGDHLHIPSRPNSISVVGEVLYSSTLGFDPSRGVDEYIQLAGGLKDSADSKKIFVILPNGRSSLVKKSLFSSNNILIPGSTIVVSRDPRPFDAINITQIITPILADLATSAAAIAAISD